MMNRWLDRGADGFRMDVISLLAKDPQLPDGTGSGYMFSPKYFAFQPRLHDYLREMRRECFDGRDCMCVGETSFVTTQNTGSVVDDGRELDMLFQFDVMDMDSGETKWDARPFDLMRFKQIISAWRAAIGGTRCSGATMISRALSPGLAVRGQRRCEGGALHVLPLPCIS